MFDEARGILNPTLTMKSYELPVNAKVDVLRRKIHDVHGNLQSLNISNCIVAQPAFLLLCLSEFKNLQTLSCIACPLRPSILLEHLLTSLQNVTHLEFSLVEAFNYAKEELLKIRLLANVHKGRETKVRKVYVEVADEKNTDLLQTFLRYCPYLRDLHVHFVRYVRFDLGLVNRLSTFTFTCEASSTAQSDPRQPVDLSYCIDLHGNVVFRKRPQAYNCAQLRNLALSPNKAFPLEPVVLVAVETKDLGRQFLIAGSRHNWSKLRSLCVLLYAGNLDQIVCPTIGANYETALRDFFAKLLNLVELNVSSFHFGDGVDFTELLAAPALRRLRALSLPPCGLRQNGAVRRLALGLSDIEDLDIRLNLDGRHESCSSCSRELVIAPADVSAFRLGSGRLTLSNVPNLASLNFLECLQVSCLRFIDVSAGPRFDFDALAKVVRYGNILHSLVVKLQSIGFGERSFKTLLYPAMALERLCLLSKSKLTSEFAEHMVQSMALRLPSIFYLHLHYVDAETSVEATVTWIRLREDDDNATADVSRRGKVMRSKPCIMCSTQTFIALVKPRNRELEAEPADVASAISCDSVAGANRGVNVAGNATSCLAAAGPSALS